MKILYLGTDVNYTNELKILISTRLSHIEISLSQCELSSPMLLSKIAEENIDIILIDYTSDINKLLETVCLLKAASISRKKPLIGLFDQAHNQEFLMLTLKSGVNFNYYKNDDNEDLILNCYYFVADNSYNLKKYATAKHQKLDYSAYYICQLTKFNKDKIEIDADFDGEKNEPLEVINHAFSEQPIINLNLELSLKNYDNHFTNRLVCEIPFKSPWEEEKDDEISMNRDTYETWIELNQDYFIKNKFSVLVIDKDVVNQLTRNEIESFPQINFIIRSDTQDFYDIIVSSKPKIIIMNLDESVNHTDIIEKLIEKIKMHEDLKPIFLIFNTISSSEAFRHAYDYTSLLATNKKFQFSSLAQILQLYLKKIESDISLDNYLSSRLLNN